jgi:hypothetical protein
MNTNQPTPDAAGATQPADSTTTIKTYTWSLYWPTHNGPVCSFELRGGRSAAQRARRDIINGERTPGAKLGRIKVIAPKPTI